MRPSVQPGTSSDTYELSAVLPDRTEYPRAFKAGTFHYRDCIESRIFRLQLLCRSISQNERGISTGIQKPYTEVLTPFLQKCSFKFSKYYQ